MCAPKRADEARGQRMQRSRRGQPDAQRASLAECRPTRRVRSGFYVREDGLAALLERAARFGQRHSARQSLEELNA